MRKKFSIDDEIFLTFVTEEDGCVVDIEDLVEVASCTDTLMVLCGSDEKWVSQDSLVVESALSHSTPVSDLSDPQSSTSIAVSPVTPIPTTPRSIQHAADIQDTTFQSKASFVKYLSEHQSSKLAMEEVLAGKYSMEDRRCITAVTASKLIDVYGSLPPSSAKVKVSSWLSDITNIEPTSFFDPKTHKGYLNKALENRRRKNPDEKKWTWSKRLRVDCKTSNLADDTVSGAPLTAVSSATVDVEKDGCLRDVQDCQYCGGKCLLLFTTLIYG